MIDAEWRSYIHSAGTYESFAKPEKPSADKKSVYVEQDSQVPSFAAFYLGHDGQVKGSVPARSLNFANPEAAAAAKDVSKGFYMRGGADNHFERCMWDMFKTFHPLETPSVSVLDEYYLAQLKHDPNYSQLCRASESAANATDKVQKKSSRVRQAVYDSEKGLARTRRLATLLLILSGT